MKTPESPPRRVPSPSAHNIEQPISHLLNTKIETRH